MRLLCLRFSAIGDVAMTAPVVKVLALAHPDLHIIMVSRPFAKAFFDGLAENVEFVGINPNEPRYQGTIGLEHLYQDLADLNPDMVADLHNVIRTKYARLRFRMAGIRISYIDKHRKGRRALTRTENKHLEQQPTAFEKYTDVFRNLGLQMPEPAMSDIGKIVSIDSATQKTANDIISSIAGEERKCIGIAPFAAHEGKIYPIEKMEEVIDRLTQTHPDLNILLFGGGSRDKEVFNGWCSRFRNVCFISEKCHGMNEELAVMQHLRCMVSMDSGNMHLASLVNTPVISIWGATHPLAGFLGWRQSDDDIVQIDLPCRPCSIYGNKPCQRGDYACLNMITPSDIVQKIEKYL